MPSLATLAYWEAVVLLVGLAGIVLWQIMTGQISLAYLLEADVRKSDGSGFTTEPSPGRVQTLIITIYVALYYLLQVINNPKKFPTLPTELVGALGVSQGAYLVGKAQSMFLGSLSDFLDRRKP
jgi:hypothetical protein